MIMHRYSIALVLLILLLSACSMEKNAEISGTIDYIGSSEIYLEEKPIHYKYADKIRYKVDPDNRGRFSKSVPVDSQKVVFFVIDDSEYPVVAGPGQDVSMTVYRANFPDSVEVEGYPEPWDDYYANYYREEQQIQQRIDGQMEGFRNGESNEVLDLYKHRYKLAKRHLADTPLDIYYYKNAGEYLVKLLENIKYRRGQNGFDADSARVQVIDKAKELNFFTIRSLEAQRAGIRDFTNAYANTFGVEDSLENEFGQELTQYDVKRLGYETMNAARVSVLEHIDQRDALAHAKMHLIAERIGEMSPETAEPSYKAYLQNFSDYPRYTNFLEAFYSEVESVSPGNPAIPFTITNQYGQPVSMEDFRGKYVLLDFWASWCIPCLDEFPHMRELYSEYDREDFEIVAISIGEDSLRWRQTIDRFKNPWPQLYAGEGFEQETFEAYQGGGIPFYILVDRSGNIERYNDVRPSFNLPELLDSLITE